MLLGAIAGFSYTEKEFSTRLATETSLRQYEYQKTTDNLIDEWIEKLAFCESSNNPLAVNPRDRDNRPKYGLFQFDFETWKFYIKKYKLFNYANWEESDWWNAIFSDYHQRVVLNEMIKHGVNLSQEFGCIRKIGLPNR